MNLPVDLWTKERGEQRSDCPAGASSIGIGAQDYVHVRESIGASGFDIAIKRTNIVIRQHMVSGNP